MEDNSHTHFDNLAVACILDIRWSGTAGNRNYPAASLGNFGITQPGQHSEYWLAIS